MPAAYQDENGKWYKQCSTTKQIFGPVDTKEEFGEWFNKNKYKPDGFRTECNLITRKGAPERNKQYRIKNNDKEKQRYKRYRLTAAGLFSKYKRSAKRRGINFTLTLEWFDEQITKPEFNICAISGIEFMNGSNGFADPFSRSLDRIDSTKGYTPDNVAWVCFRYNSWKCDLSHEEIRMIYEYSSKYNSVSSIT